MNQKTKLLIGKIAVYLLLVISVVTYSKGWLTFDDKDVRKATKQGAKAVLEQIDELDKDDIETIQEQFDDNEVKVKAKTFLKQTEKANEALKDAEVSPAEISTIATLANSAMKIAKEYEGELFSEKDFEEFGGRVALANILAKLAWILTLVSILCSIALIIRGSFVGPIPYAVMALINFILLLVMKLQMEDGMKEGAEILSALGVQGVDSKSELKILPPAYITLVLAILAVGAWIWVKSESTRSRIVIPGLYTQLKKTGQENLNKESLKRNMGRAAGAASKLGGDVVERVREASSGAMADEVYCAKCGKPVKAGEAFCGFCGEPVPNQIGTKCPQCGTIVKPGEAFCPECGNRMASVKMQPSGEQTAIIAADRVAPKLSSEEKRHTVLLDEGPDMPRAYLVLGDNEYDIDSSKFAIGRDTGNLIIAGDHVSHEHAEITFEGGVFFIADQKSSNHTYVNGQMLMPYEPFSLSDGDVIRFADIEAVFHLG